MPSTEGLNVNVAMVGTKVDQVVDIFYVREAWKGTENRIQDQLRTDKTTQSSIVFQNTLKGG
jgi:hypothetical protein